MKQFKERISNPIFLLAMSGLLYKILSDNGVLMNFEDFKTYVDMVSYIVLGYGIYHSNPAGK